jgi:two-component system, response regulator
VNAVDIIIIEDNRHDIEMILAALNEKVIRNKVHVINDGAEALNYFFGPEGCTERAIRDLPKLILLDLKLPKFGGLEIMKSIRSDERTKYIPIVVFTSSDEEQDRIECYSFGANSYIVKPMDADVFSRCVADIGSYWVQMNRATHVDAYG